jgi:tripartite-type tricarboxylate transporter receptor subunit TctC
MARQSPTRRCALRLIAGAGSMIAPAMFARAQNLPDRSLRIVSPYTAGGLGDTLPRLVAIGLGESLGKQVIVENIPGASQLIGVQTVARAAPDGATILFASSTSMGINVAASKAPAYDPLRDFAPIGIAFSTPLYLVVNPKVKATTVAELVDLAGEMFKSLAGIDIIHVPYKGTGPALNDVIAGQVDMMFGGEGAEHARQGSLRALAVTDSVRSKSFPDIPTMQEAGIPGYEMSIWFGFVAPAGTPKPIIDLLSREIRKALANPLLRQRANGTDITPGTPEEMTSRIAKDIDMWRKTIRDANVELQ